VDGSAIIIILAIAGVVSVLLFAVKGILDQLPDVFDSFRRARDAWKRLKEEQGEVATSTAGEAAKPEETEEQPPEREDEEPPVAA
jgi:Sec-independent protein translocase protein TatA